MRLLATFLIVADRLITLGIAIELPPPTGQYFVGVSKHAIPYHDTTDPVAPGNLSEAFLATIWYPSLQKPCGGPVPAYDPVTAAVWETAAEYPNGSLSSLTAQIRRNATIAPAPEDGSLFPTLLFGPGLGGPPTEMYAIILSELASRGYVVVAIDHPYEQPFVRFPNGTGVYGWSPTYAPSENETHAVYEVRVRENVFFIKYWPTLIRKLNAPFAATNLGAFGHSLGGAHSLGTTLRESPEILTSALNMDGSIWDNLEPDGYDAGRPVLLLSSGGHTSLTDETWANFEAAQTGWWREISVNGSAHLDYSDATFWKQIGGPVYGTIDPLRMANITRTFVTAFFNQTLLGQDEPILNEPSAAWPEVFGFTGNNGTFN